jgi:hypothetical protein
MVKISPSGRIGQQVGVKPITQRKQAQTIQQVKQSVKQSKPQVNYESAWKEAQKHFNKGMAGAYLQHMEREAMENPRIGAVYKYVKLLAREQKAGNISPSSTGLAQVKRDIRRQELACLSPSQRLQLKLTPKQKLERAASIKKAGEQESYIFPSTFVGPLQPGTIRTPRKIYNPQEYRLTQEDIKGTGKITKAIDVGGGKMQDFVISYSKGNILSVTSTGPQVPQSQRFKDMAGGYSFASTETTPFFGAPSPELREKRAESSRWFFEKVLGSDPSLTPKREYVTGKDFSLRYAHMWAGAKLSSYFEDKAPSYLKSEAPEWLVGPIAELPTWATFSPLIKTGTAAQTESKYTEVITKEGKKIFVKKADIVKFLETESKGKVVTILGKESGKYSEKASKLLKLLKDAKTTEAKKAAIDAARQVYGDTFVKDFISQEASRLSSGAVKVATTQKYTPTIRTYEIELPQVFTMERLDILGASLSKDLFQPSKTGQTNWLGSASLQSPKISFMQPPQQQPPKQITKQASIQKPAFKQNFAQRFTPALTIPTSVIQKPSAKYPRYSGAITPKQLTAGIPKVMLFGDRKPFETSSVKKGSFIPQVMSKGRWVTVGKRMDRNSALSRASRGADLSTSRKFRILPSRKASQITSIVGWGSRRYKFRPYKKVKGKKVGLQNVWIEKKKYAIDTPSEKRGLSIAKLSKQMRWGLPIQKKRKKKTVKRRKK